jgi:hypothetical protein
LLASQLRQKANSQIRDTQMADLKQVDNTYAPERNFLANVKKDYFNRDGSFKDLAPSRIMNATNKADLLGRLEELMPGITKRIEVLKAVEDIQRASGIKVGSYGRIVSGGIGYATSGIAGLLVAEILTSPAMAVPILRNAGYLGSKATPIINTLKLIGGDVQKPSAGLMSSLIQPKE